MTTGCYRQENTSNILTALRELFPCSSHPYSFLYAASALLTGRIYEDAMRYLSFISGISLSNTRLPNGLKVILHQDNMVPVVAVTMLYHVGSKNEKLGQSGFAHFFEHLIFEGSQNIARGQFMKYVSNAGGQLNANTSQDRIFYYENLPSNQLKLGLWLESERMMHTNIESAGVNTQREVVKEGDFELGQRKTGIPACLFGRALVVKKSNTNARMTFIRAFVALNSRISG